MGTPNEDKATGSLPDYEQMASFYLGKRFDLVGRQLRDEKVLYDAKDLTTHAMCVGMTGSGKTGLCLSLLEEAALDGIPAICIDPKGDLGNLLLAFPDFTAADFQPWVDPQEAVRQGVDDEELARQTAALWKAGIEGWDQDADRVRRYQASVDRTIYTPGSNAGMPMTVLKSFDAPPSQVLQDDDILRERVAGAASGLLTLMGIDADPLSSKEHILLSKIFEHAWRAGTNLDLPSLIHAIQSPPLDKIGVFDLDTYFPAAERAKLAMTLNNLLASPSFSGWLEGQPLNVKELLYTSDGKPRHSIISIAHLSDQERMFFVTILLNELLSWVRTQPGTSSLRALFYMDEVYGYFPPTAKPPSKPPMMVLLKQARAFGLGLVLATQNPVDLDYKGLSNIGTWFLGRLQTQRDKERVLDGLEGAAAQTGMRFDKAAMEQTLAALGGRVFLMNNVHDDGPILFQTRWALSFLRGPLSRPQIQRLMETKRETEQAESAEQDATQHDVLPTAATAPTAVPTVATQAASARPLVPVEIEERFCEPTLADTKAASGFYRPALLARTSCHYVRTSAGLDDWFDRSLLWEANNGGLDAELWSRAQRVDATSLDLSKQPLPGWRFDDLPTEMLNARAYKSWEKDVRDFLYRHLPMTLYECEELQAYSQPGQDELDARLAWQQQVRELRDQEKEELQVKYSKKVAALESKIRSARQRVEREQAQYDSQKWSSVIDIGQTVLGAFLGNKIGRRSATAGRSVGRAAQQRTDVVHAEETLRSLEQEKYALENECETEIHNLQDRYRIENLTLEPIKIPCRKGDMKVQPLQVVWLPWGISAQGQQVPLYSLTSLAMEAP